MGKRKHQPWQQEFDWAAVICAPLGCTVTRSEAQFEIAKVLGEGVALIIYPHRTTAGNYHARVRDQNSADKPRAAQVMRALDSGEGLPEQDRDRVRFSCTFQHKSLPLLPSKGTER